MQSSQNSVCAALISQLEHCPEVNKLSKHDVMICTWLTKHHGNRFRARSPLPIRLTAKMSAQQTAWLTTWEKDLAKRKMMFKGHRLLLIARAFHEASDPDGLILTSLEIC